jgi:hypothetical protein
MTVPPASLITSRSVAVPDAEVDDRYAQRLSGHRRERASHVRLDVLGIIFRRQIAHPRVEELDGVGAGGDLGAKIAAHDLGELVHERVPRVGAPNMSFLVFAKLALLPPSMR